MSEESPSPPSQIRTRSKNKNAHPGAIVRGPPRRSSAEVQLERAAKTQAKAAQEAEKRQNIQRAAAFELTDMANEDIVDITPRPASFAPKLWPPHNHKKADLAPIAEVGDDPNDSSHPLSSMSANSPPCFEESVTEEEPTSGSDSQHPIPAKKLKARTPRKATTKVGRAPPVREKLKAALPVEEVAQALDEETALISDEEPPQRPKPKNPKVKPVKVRDSINLAAKKIVEKDKMQNDGGNMEKPTPGQQTWEELSGSSAPKAPSQVQWRRPLKRAGAIANIDASCSDQPEAKRTKPSRDVMR